MKKKYTDISLTSGWRVRCRKVPPLAFQGAVERADFWYPPPPRITVKTVAGDEEVAAPDESPEAIAYFHACREIDHKRELFQGWFILDMGVMAWAEDGEGEIADAEWLTEPPGDWELDPLIEEYVEHLPEKRRVQFISYELIRSSSDFTDVNNATLLPDQTPVREGEVQAAEDFFRDSVPGEESEGVGE